MVRFRDNKGSILFISMFVLSLFVLILWQGSIVAVQLHRLQQHRSAADAASLEVAQRISTIVICTKRFGLVSLSDHVIKDGGTEQCQYVTGINTLLATARMQLLIADQLCDHQMQTLALADLHEVRCAALELESSWRAAIDPVTSRRPRDLSGNRVNAHDAACKIYAGNVGASEFQRIKNIRIALGHLSGKFSTVTTICETSMETGEYECYPAFVNVPACHEDFYFAGVGENTGLVESHRFREADSKLIDSIVQVKVEIDSRGDDSDWWSGTAMTSCAVPFAQSDRFPSASLLIAAPRGLPEAASIMSWLRDSQLRTSKAEGFLALGDYPVEADATLVPRGGEFNSHSIPVADMLGETLYDWLWSCHGRFDLHAMVTALEEDILSSSDKLSKVRGFVLLSCLADRSVNTEVLDCNPLLSAIVHDNQPYGYNFQACKDARGTWSVLARNYVHNLGPVNGGKHLGQPLQLTAASKKSRAPQINISGYIEFLSSI